MRTAGTRRVGGSRRRSRRYNLVQRRVIGTNTQHQRQHNTSHNTLHSTHDAKPTCDASMADSLDGKANMENGSGRCTISSLASTTCPIHGSISPDSDGLLDYSPFTATE